MLETIKRRRSIRRYTAENVGDDQVRLLLEAAMAAPTAHNMRPWHFVVVRRQDMKDALAETHEYSKMIARAPVVFVVCAERDKVHWVEDACLAAENLLLEAVALGLGAAWVAVYPHEEYEIFVRGVLEIPEEVGIVCMLPVGHPAETKPARTQYDARKVHFERFGGAGDNSY